jgi:hypothetical protein
MLINDAVAHEFDAIRYFTGEEIKSVQIRLAGRRDMPTLVNTIRSTYFSRLRQEY